MPRVRVDLSGDELVLSLRSGASRLRASEIRWIDFCQMEDAIHQGDEEFHILHGERRFWIIGPFVDGALAAIRELRESHPSIPTRRVVVHKLPRKLRSPGLLGLRLFPIAGLGEFPITDLPPVTPMGSSSDGKHTS